MRKGKILLFLFIFCLCASLFTVSTFAEDVTEEVETVAVTYQDQLNDFWNKWFGPLVSIGFGSLSAGGVILFFWKVLTRNIKKSEEKNDQAHEDAKEGLNTAKESYESSNAILVGVIKNIEEDFSNFTNQYNALVEKYQKQFDIQTNEINLLLTHLSVLKSLVCKLVASNPDLASNGYATEIMKLCNEADLFELKTEILNEYKELKEGENNE